jgi:two-component system response regulator PilR (NtrC family)
MADRNERILVADDERELRDMLVSFLRGEGYEVDGVEDGEAALQALRGTAYDLLLTDLRMPRLDGVELLKEALALYPELLVIMLTGFATVESAVEAMRIGAYHYLQKPVRIAELSEVIKRAIHSRQLKLENEYLRGQLRRRYRFDSIIGNSESMIEVFKVVEKVANSPTTVLITGESGTGKELIARAVHHNGPRKARPMVSVNCGAITDTLLEDELFGHVRGAYTDAHAARVGRFEQADKGTLFLDEVGNMSGPLQVKLLRVLQEKTFERVGSLESVKVDVRIIAATSADLEKMVQEGRFRKDLYYRLNVINIRLPPLRERRGDIPLLVQHLVRKVCDEQQRPVKVVPQPTMRLLMDYDWPGNVRELENVIERAVTLLGDRPDILPGDLPPELTQPGRDALFGEIHVPDEGLAFNTVVSNLEKALILKTLEKTGGNKKAAAELLGLKRTTLLEKLKRFQSP